MKRGTVVCSGVFTALSTENPRDPRFIADVMVGRLARWLRILGFDVLYSNRYEDDEIIRIADADSRLVLTRDRRLASRISDHSILIEADDIDAQILQVVEHAGIREFHPFRRCIACNSLLTPVDKESVFHRIPHYVYWTQEQFAECSACHRIYWRGTHSDKMMKKLQRLSEGFDRKQTY